MRNYSFAKKLFTVLVVLQVFFIGIINGQSFLGINVGINATGRIITAPFVSKDIRVFPKIGPIISGEIGFGSKSNGDWRLEMGYQLNKIHKKINSADWLDKNITSWHGIHFGLNKSFHLNNTDKTNWNMFMGISLNKVFQSQVKRDGRMYDSSSGLWDNYSYSYKDDDTKPFCFGLQAGIEYVLKLKETFSLVFQNSYHIQTSRSTYFPSGDNYLTYGVLSIGFRFY